MNIIISAIGKLKGAELALYEQYAKRLPWKVRLHEFEIKKNLIAEKRKAEEAQLLLSVCKGAKIIALDERGKEFASGDFARQLQKYQLQGDGSLAFIIGGADGLDDTIRKQADILLSLGRATWPHLLARAMLMEQLYRAQTILSGHPYHRE